MSVQFPQLSLQEQTDRYQEMGKLTAFPYTYYIGINLFSAVFPKTTASIPYFQAPVSYLSYAFQADNNLSITAIQLQLQLFISGGTIAVSTWPFIVALSYSPTLLATPTDTTTALPIPTIPNDIGNEIYKHVTLLANQNYPTVTTQAQPVLIDIYQRFNPNRYLVKYNQYLYLHIGSAGIINSASYSGNITGVLILHTTPTGLKI